MSFGLPTTKSKKRKVEGKNIPRSYFQQFSLLFNNREKKIKQRLDKLFPPIIVHFIFLQVPHRPTSEYSLFVNCCSSVYTHNTHLCGDAFMLVIYVGGWGSIFAKPLLSKVNFRKKVKARGWYRHCTKSILQF